MVTSEYFADHNSSCYMCDSMSSLSFTQVSLKQYFYECRCCNNLNPATLEGLRTYLFNKVKHFFLELTLMCAQFVMIVTVYEIGYHKLKKTIKINIFQISNKDHLYKIKSYIIYHIAIYFGITKQSHNPFLVVTDSSILPTVFSTR